MSDGEVFITIVGLLGTLTFWGFYYGRFRRRVIGQPVPGKPILFLAPVAVAALLIATLTTVASFDVVNDPKYIFQYFVVGMAWTGFGAFWFRSWGISIRDDVVERRNPAVVPAFAGGMLGVVCCYCGGNIGDGPGWWVVLVAAAIATGALFLLWHLLERFTYVSDAVTIDRDVAAGNRLGGFLLGSGLILGRGVAGDWVSLDATLGDFGQTAWPAVVLLVVAIVIERASQPTAERPEPDVTTLGVVPGLVYAGAAAAYVAWLGMPQ